MIQSIRDSIRRWQSFRRNPQFWQWVEDIYSREDLDRLTKEATDYDGSYELCFYFPVDPHVDFAESWASLRKWLYSHYGKDIWYWCAEEAHQKTFGTSIGECHKAHGRTTLILFGTCPHIVHEDKWNLLEGFGRMDMAQYANSPDDFEEFMVRNALKKAAAHILSMPERTDRKGAIGEKSR